MRVFDSESVFRKLGIRERVVPLRRTEAWKPWILLGLTATKECLKGFVQSPQNILKNLSVNFSTVGSVRSDLGKLFALLFVSNSNLVGPPCFSPLLEGSVIKFAAYGQDRLKNSGLLLSGIEAVLEGSAYNGVRHGLVPATCDRPVGGIRPRRPSCLIYIEQFNESTPNIAWNVRAPRCIAPTMRA
jgi:hypothetical protein